MSTDERREDGFEYQGQFYRWHLSDMGKDLMLIDRIAGTGITDFFEMADEGIDTGRPALMLTMIATSIRHAHPDWSVERIHRLVMNLSLSEIVLVGDEAEDVTLPPASGPPATPPPGEPSTSPRNGSSSPSTLPASSTSEASSANPT